jgi:hypothetical protein
MRHIAAYLLLQIGGNANPSAADVKKVLGAVGVEADDERLKKLIAELKGKSIDQLIAEGSAKLSSVRLHIFTLFYPELIFSIRHIRLIPDWFSRSRSLK